MKFFILTVNHLNFYTELLEKWIASGEVTPDTKFDDLLARLYNEFFYLSDTYVDGLRSNGHTADQIIPTEPYLQRLWAAQNNFAAKKVPNWMLRRPFRWYWTLLRRENMRDLRLQSDILLEQIRRARPDVLYKFGNVPVTRELLRKIRPYCGMIVLQTCFQPYAKDSVNREFDLVINCAQHVVEIYREQGYKAEYLPHNFDSRILQQIEADKPLSRREHALLFSGSLMGEYHGERRRLLEFLAQHTNIELYTEEQGVAVQSAPIHERSAGTRGGLDLYRLMADSRLVLNQHGDNGHVARGGGDGHAKRIFEVTGAGALLFTDRLDYRALFDEQAEIVVYSDPEDCLRKAQYYLSQPDEANEIARAGHQRTLKDHNHVVRMKRLVEILTAEARF